MNVTKNISQKSIFSATFDESKRIVKKEILTESGAGVGVLSSMSIWKRIQSLILLIFAGICYVIGAWIPLFVTEEGQKSGMSESTIKLILMFGNPMILVTKIIVIIFVALILLNLFPKGNYAFQLAYGYIVIISFIVTFLLVMLPISLALTITSFGWVGLVLEIICCIYLWKVLVISSYQEIKNKLYKGTGKIKNWDKVLMKYIKRYGPILLVFSIITVGLLTLVE